MLFFLQVSANVLIYHCCIVVGVFSSWFTSHKCNHCTTKIPRNNSSLFLFTRIPWDVATETYAMVSFIGRGVNWNRMSGVLQTRKHFVKILLCLDRWFAPVLITTIKHSSKLHHPSLEAEYAWRLTEIPYCEIITQQKILRFGALAGFKVFLARGRLPVFCCLLLLITSNNSGVVLCQTPKATLTPRGLSPHLVSSLFSFTRLACTFAV